MSIEASTSLIAMGTIAGNGFQAVGIASSTETARITVGEACALIGATTEAISGAVRDQFFLSNAGLIAGAFEAVNVSAALISGITADFWVTNIGTIQSTSASSAEPTVRFNTPVGSALTIANAGLIVNGGFGAAVSLTGERLDLTNTGTIQARSAGNAVTGEVGGDDLVNDGSIIGAVRMNTGNDEVRKTGTINGLVDKGDGQGRLTNTGTILGDVTMGGFETAGLNVDFLSNVGLIGGSVDLGDGNDFFISTGGRVTGVIDGQAGSDTFTIDRTDLIVSDGSSDGGIDALFASVNYAMGTGIERLFLQGPTGLVGTGSARNDNIFGGSGDDTIRGSDGNDSISGGLGDDRLFDGRGNDRIVAFGDDDVIRACDGNDSVVLSIGNAMLGGGQGNDLPEFTVSGGTVSLDLGRGTAEVIGTGAWEFDSFEFATGTSGNDTMLGTDGINVLNGGQGRDVIDGGKGDDTINSGAGVDTMTGGKGADESWFQFVSDSPAATPDLITDFSRNDDVFFLEQIDASGGGGGPTGFSYIGTGAFTGATPEVHYSVDSVAVTATVELRLGGSNTNDMVIVLTGVVNLTADNFILQFQALAPYRYAPILGRKQRRDASSARWTMRLSTHEKPSPAPDQTSHDWPSGPKRHVPHQRAARAQAKPAHKNR